MLRGPSKRQENHDKVEEDAERYQKSTSFLEELPGALGTKYAMTLHWIRLEKGCVKWVLKKGRVEWWGLKLVVRAWSTTPSYTPLFPSMWIWLEKVTENA